MKQQQFHLFYLPLNVYDVHDSKNKKFKMRKDIK